LIASFETYAEAVAAAAVGLEANNASLIQQAIDGIEHANAVTGDAVGELEVVASSCGLIIADPATPSSAS
jgi:hypothetical protein